MLKLGCDRHRRATGKVAVALLAHFLQYAEDLSQVHALLLWHIDCFDAQHREELRRGHEQPVGEPDRRQ